jgi:hypothetical protein
VKISDCVEDNSHAIMIHLAYLKRLLLEKDPTGEFSDIGRSNLKTYYRIPPMSLLGYTRYIDWLVGEMDFYEKVKFPKFGGADEKDSCDGREGSIMVRHQSRSRSFLVRMGYLRSVMLYDEFSISDIGLDLFRELLEGRYSPVMEYLVIRTIPTWYAQIHETL